MKCFGRPKMDEWFICVILTLPFLSRPVYNMVHTRLPHTKSNWSVSFYFRIY